MLKISGPNSLASASRASRPAAGSGFALTEPRASSDTPDAAVALGVSALGSVDALIALQEVEGPLGRRRRAIGRAGRLLDQLDALKLAVLDGEISDTGLRRLAATVREQRDATTDPGLEALLDQIEARAAVELAKLEIALKAA